MKRSDKLKALRAEKIKAAGLITAKCDAEKRDVMTPEEEKQFTALHAEAVGLRSQISLAQEQEELEAEIKTLDEPPAPSSTLLASRAVPVTEQNANLVDDFMRPPAHSPALYAGIRNAKDVKTAYRFGVYVAAVLGLNWAVNKAKSMGMPMALLNEGTNVNGGYLIPDEFSNLFIDLRQKYGVFRRKSKIVPMSRDRIVIPRRTGGLTAYPVGEGATGTESTKTWDRVTLVAQKWMVLTRMTSEVSEDSLVNLGDDMIGEMAYAFAVAEDGAGFNGDGTSAYAGIVGLKNALNAGAKYTQGTGNTWAAQVIADINGLMSLLPDYTLAPNPEFYCNKAYYHQVLERLAFSVGGNTGLIVANGIPQFVFMGYPVNFVAALPAATATTGICAYFGDLSAGTKLGDRRQITMAMSTDASIGGQSMFERDEIGMKATERFDISCHERGTASAGGVINAIITG